MRVLILLIFILSSICFAQSDLMTIELYNGQVYTYSVSDIDGFSVSPGITGIEEEQAAQAVINSFFLHQNFPNPFNPGTTIKYEIPAHGLVQINIFDIKGELVCSLRNNEQEKGVHTVNWDGKSDAGISVSSGAYFCRIVYNNNFLIKKMLLIR